MSSDTPSDDFFDYYDDFDSRHAANLSKDELRALELVRRFEHRSREYFESLAIFRIMRSKKLLENLERIQDLTDEYNPARPFKLEVITRDGTLKIIGAWNLCATVFEGVPTWVYVDANSGETYMAQLKYDNDTTPPEPLAPEDLSFYDLDDVKHLIRELEQQGTSLSYLAAEMGEG